MWLSKHLKKRMCAVVDTKSGACADYGTFLSVNGPEKRCSNSLSPKGPGYEARYCTEKVRGEKRRVMSYRGEKKVSSLNSLNKACAKGDLSTVRELLSNSKADSDAADSTLACASSDSTGSTPLHLACAEGHLDVVRVCYHQSSRLMSIIVKIPLGGLHCMWLVLKGI